MFFIKGSCLFSTWNDLSEQNSDGIKLLAIESIRYLDASVGTTTKSVYDAPSAFQKFIEKGGNIELYQDIVDHFSSQYFRILREKRESSELNTEADIRILDIGVGDGSVLVPVIERLQDQSSNVEITLVEPSTEMLTISEQRLRSMGLRVQSFHMTAQEFTKLLQENDESVSELNWDVVQASFSLQCLKPLERVDLWRALLNHQSRTNRDGFLLMVAECDVPDVLSAEHLAFLSSSDLDTPTTKTDRQSLSPPSPTELAQLVHVFNTYAQGFLLYFPSSFPLSDYISDFSVESALLADYRLVCQGFLVPMLFGYLKNGNYEHSAQKWEELAVYSGFSSTSLTFMYPYWWGRLFVLNAQAQ